MTLIQDTQTSEFTLPDGYAVRPLTMDDAEAIARFDDAASLAQGDDDKHDPDQIRSDWTQPDFDLGTASQAVIAPDGEIAGVVVVWDTGTVPVRPWVHWETHPDYRSQGIEQYLVQWAEQRARQTVDRCPPEARVSMISGLKMGVAHRERVFHDFEFKEIRRFYRMMINMTEAPSAPVLSEGFSIRHYHHPDELEALTVAFRDSFQDHWGFVTQPLEDDLKEWEHWLATDKLFDETLFFLAIDDATGAIAGMSLCLREEHENPKVAYVDILGVGRDYRKKGLGLALLRHSFGELWRRGRKDVTLGVDATSLTGALRLYERAGMHVDRTWINFEKELRPGIELATTKVDAG